MYLKISLQDKKPCINTNQKKATQNIGAKWPQLIPPPSGSTGVFRKQNNIAMEPMEPMEPRPMRPMEPMELMEPLEPHEADEADRAAGIARRPMEPLEPMRPMR